MAGIYIARMDDVSVSAAGLQLEVFAPATAALLIRRAKISAKGGTTGDQVEATLVRRTAVSTGGLAVITAQPLGNYAAFAGSCRSQPTGGTTGATLYDDGFNLLGPGWEWVPIDREGFIPVAPSTGVAVSLDTAPAAARNLMVSIEFQVID